MDILLSLTLMLSAFAGNADTGPDMEMRDTLSESIAVSSVKQLLPLEKLASPVTTVYLTEMEYKGLNNPNDLSVFVPNLFMPDYGSSMTSSIYMRGFGSRIDNPVVGFYIDDVPVMNKNSYDLDMMDIRRADFFRGPQGTLYGRNSMCGVLSLNTLSPASFQGYRAELSYGAANEVKARFSAYYRPSETFGFSVLAGYRHSDGLYENAYDGSKCDPSNSLTFRFRLDKTLSDKVYIENSVYSSGIIQGGWPYNDGRIISYNDTCSYRRMNFTEAFKLKYSDERFVLNSITSWQFLADEMKLDQDFTPASMFTLKQSQIENAITQEFVLRPAEPWKNEWLDWQGGFFGFFKYNSMSAPVNFKKDGIRELILDNINGNIPDDIGELHFMEDNFTIGSDFGIATLGTAVYGESYFTWKRWLLTAGVRFDFEWTGMDYASDGTVHYMFVPTMSGYRENTTVYAGSTANSYFEILPKLSLMYDLIPDKNPRTGIKAYGTISKGYKSGGFNTQIFSDILQNKMMVSLMNDLGVYLDGGTDFMSAEHTTYKPENSWNFELGMSFHHKSSDGSHILDSDLSVFRINCVNQQVTLFPPGKSTGRMMANVGKSRSCGIEMETSYRWKHLKTGLSFGYADAVFLDYDDGNNDYSGNRIPYSPEYTAMADLSYEIPVPDCFLRDIVLNMNYRLCGRIWWDDANTLSQPAYGILSANVVFDVNPVKIIFRGENLTGTRYDLFWFRSVGNDFYQSGRPFTWSVGLSFEI